MNFKISLAILSAIFIFAGCSSTQKQAQNDPQSKYAHRMGTLTIKTTPGAIVNVNQLQHEFPFGTCLNNEVFEPEFGKENTQKFLQIVKDNFNCAVPNKAIKWPACERQQGVLTYDDADTIVNWCLQNDFSVRGHCIFWAKPKHIQQWVMDLDDQALEAAIKKRITDLLTYYKGRIKEYDVNNEMIHEHFYEERLGFDINVKMFQWAHQIDPNAVLYTNDFRVCSGIKDDTDKYINHIDQLIKAGAPVGGIGIQGHFHDQLPVKADVIKHKLDKLARFGLPIKVTEFDIDIKDEQLKAKWLTEFYELCFAHPAIEGILMWGFYRPLHWRPDSALWEEDFSPTPAALAYRDLVYNKWWTKEQVKADSNGLCQVRAFFGKHMIESNGKKIQVTLSKKEGSKTIDLN